MKVGVIGAGAWGTALAIVAGRGGNDVVLWSYDGVATTFDGVAMPTNITITQNMADLADAAAWLLVTPAAFARETLRRAREYYRGVPIIICTKGADPKTGEFMSEILGQEIPECTEYGVLSGPQFAAEVANAVPTGSTLAGGRVVCETGRQILNKLELDFSDDIIGAQLCGTGKNAVALACGYASVAAGGENERALIFTRAWNDVVRLGLAMGAKCNTFLGLCGIGDLVLSATSTTSRNFSGGAAIARGDAPAGTVEGIYAMRGLIRRAAELNVSIPTLTAMWKKMGLE